MVRRAAISPKTWIFPARRESGKLLNPNLSTAFAPRAGWHARANTDLVAITPVVVLGLFVYFPLLCLSLTTDTRMFDDTHKRETFFKVVIGSNRRCRNLLPMLGTMEATQNVADRF